MQKVNDRYLTQDDLYLSIVRGFYPARWEIEGKPIKNYYSNYLKTFIERDVSEFKHVRVFSLSFLYSSGTVSVWKRPLQTSQISSVVTGVPLRLVPWMTQPELGGDR